MKLDDYHIKIEVLSKWLLTIYMLTGSESLDNAIALAKMVASSQEDRELSSTIAVLYRAECSGEIDPPVALREMYSKIVEKKTA
jgi:hypothetical protein